MTSLPILPPGGCRSTAANTASRHFANGSPPRVRGAAKRLRVGTKVRGLTPASAGSSTHNLLLQPPYDIADLYKTKTSIPSAFEVAASGNPDVSTAVRYSMRDKFAKSRLLETCVRDIQQLLVGAELSDESSLADVVMLWDPIGSVAAGSNYSEEWDLS